MVMSKRKPIVLFVSHDASRTGAPLCLSEFLNAIADKDVPYSPYVFVTGDGPLVSEWRNRNLPVVLSKKRVHANIPVKVLSLLRSTAVYMRLLHAVKPMLIYSNTIRNGLEVAVARLFGIQTLVHVHEGESIMKEYALNLRISSLFTSKFVCASEYSARSLEKVVGRKASVVHNGVQVEKSDFSASRNSTGAVMTLGMVGGIQPNKGQRVTIDALAKLVRERNIPVRLRLFGEVEDAEYRRLLDEKIATLALGPFVEFCGSVADRATIYGSVDVLVMASYDECFPRVVLEAFAYSKPVVATNVGGVPEIVRNNENGLLVPPGDSERLAEAIARLASDPGLVGRITETAARDVTQRFRLEDSVTSLHAKIVEALIRTHQNQP
jgi:glycosyltransferase involved in cell wall biosynthesis